MRNAVTALDGNTVLCGFPGPGPRVGRDVRVLRTGAESRRILAGEPPDRTAIVSPDVPDVSPLNLVAALKADEPRRAVYLADGGRERRLDRRMKAAGLDGVVCSPLEAAIVKEHCGKDFVTVTPGVRFSDSAKDDQARITTPAKAKEIGSDYIVVGRPITQAEDPVAAYERCVREFCD